MKSNQIIALFFFSILQTWANAQSAGKVTGKVLDATTQVAVPFATLYLFNAPITPGAKPSKSGFTDDIGAFAWRNLDSGSYVLRVIIVGYEKVEMNVEVATGGDGAVPTVLLHPTSAILKEVTVTANVPLIEVKPDRFVYNVASDPTNAGATTPEILQKVPFITVMPDEKILVKGKSSYKVMLNGRSTGLFAHDPSDALRNYPPHLIAKIEVITAPGARYDAEGLSGIINIVTLKKVAGYRGTVSVNGNTLGNYEQSASLSVKKSKIGWTAQISNNVSNAPTKYGYNRNNNSPELTLQKEEREGVSDADNASTSLFGEIVWDIDSNNALSIHSKYYRNVGNSFAPMEHSGYGTGGTLLEQGRFEEAYYDFRSSLGIGANYFKKIGKSGQSLEISVLSSTKNTNSEQDYLRNFQLGSYDSRRILTDNLPEQENTFEINYESIKLKNLMLNTGIKGIDRHLKNTYANDTLSFDNEAWGRITEQSGLFDYRQRIGAGYIQTVFMLGKFGFSAGLRYEHTFSDGQLDENQPFSTDYGTLFPSASSSYSHNKAGDFNFSVTKRLQRPGLFYLNPQTTNLDPRNISSGNPYLEPEFIYTAELNWSKRAGKKMLIASLSQAVGTDIINPILRLEAQTGISNRTFENQGRSYTTAGMFTINTPLSTKISIMIKSEISLVNNQGIPDGIGQSSWGASGMQMLNLNYRLSKTWRLSGGGIYILPQYTLQSKSSGFYSYDFSVNKRFVLKNKNAININLGADAPGAAPI